MTIADNFWAACDRSGGPEVCWPWLHSRSTKGYGRLHVDGRTKAAHRHAYELAKGPAPSHLVVMHSCDNPCCVNPVHLSLGTTQDNAIDCVSKGRMHVNEVASRGEENMHAIFTCEQVLAIRARADTGERPTDIARELGCSSAAIFGIKNRTRWGWL